jgi:hypothetical protein
MKRALLAALVTLSLAYFGLSDTPARSQLFVAPPQLLSDISVQGNDAHFYRPLGYDVGVVYTQGGGDDRAIMSRNSSDNGRTWGTAVPVSPQGNTTFDSQVVSTTYDGQQLGLSILTRRRLLVESDHAL